MIQGSINIIDISAIQRKICDDGKKRYLLDSVDKIISWINYQFSIQAQNDIDDSEKFIDLSDCIIYTKQDKNNPVMTNICDLAGKIDCIIDTVGNCRSQMSKFHTEILKNIRCNNSIIYTPSFHGTKFHKAIHIEYTQFIGNCDLGGSFFEKRVFIQHCKMQSLLCDNAIFNRGLYLWDINFDAFQISLRKCEFNKEVKIGEIRFDESRYGEPIKKGEAWMSFYGSIFRSDLKLFEIDFQRPLDFCQCSFEGKVTFEKVTSDNQIIFSESEFKRQLLLSSNNIEKQITIKSLCLNNIMAHSRIDIECSVIESLVAQFMQIDTKGIFRICNCKISKLDMDLFCNNGYIFFDNNVKGIVEISFNSAINNGIIELENTEIKNLSSRKTARLLKDSAYKSNNSIDAVYYKSQEMKFYWKELSTQVFNKKVLYSIQDLILLSFNTISNYYGRYWILGVIFTISISFIFYSLYSFSIGNLEWTMDFKSCILFKETYWKEVLNFFWLPNLDGFKELSNSKTTIGSYIWFISGKILIGYGIYQTIVAFRKYSK